MSSETGFVGVVNVHLLWGRDFYDGPEGTEETPASPYVLAKYRKTKSKSKVHKDDHEPYFDEVLTFDLTDGEDQVLSLEVRDRRTLRDKFLGYVALDLRRVLSPHGVEEWFTLGPKPGKKSAFRGALYVAVSFSKFVIRIQRAIDLIDPARESLIPIENRSPSSSPSAKGAPSSQPSGPSGPSQPSQPSQPSPESKAALSNSRSSPSPTPQASGSRPRQPQRQDTASASSLSLLDVAAGASASTDSLPIFSSSPSGGGGRESPHSPYEGGADAGKVAIYGLVKYGSKRERTDVVSNTLSPVFEKTFHFRYAIGAPSFEIELWAKGRLVDTFLGRIVVFLNDFKNGDVDNSWYSLLPRAEHEVVTGRVNLLVQAFTVPQDLQIQYQPLPPSPATDELLFEPSSAAPAPSPSSPSAKQDKAEAKVAPSPEKLPAAATDTRFKTIHPSSWSLDDIHAWLYSLGMERFFRSFARHEVDGEALVHLSTLEIAAGLSIPMGPAKKFFLSVQDAKVRYANYVRSKSAIPSAAAAVATATESSPPEMDSDVLNWSAASALSPPHTRRSSFAAINLEPEEDNDDHHHDVSSDSDSGSLKFDSDEEEEGVLKLPDGEGGDGSSSFWSSSDDDDDPAAADPAAADPAADASDDATSVKGKGEDDDGEEIPLTTVGAGAVALNVMCGRDLVDPSSVAEKKMNTYITVRHGSSSKHKIASKTPSYAPEYNGRLWIPIETTKAKSSKTDPASITFDVYRSRTLTSKFLGRATLLLEDLPTDGSLYDGWLDVVTGQEGGEEDFDSDNESDDEEGGDGDGNGDQISSPRSATPTGDGVKVGAIHVHAILSLLEVTVVKTRGLGAATQRSSMRAQPSLLYGSDTIPMSTLSDAVPGGKDVELEWDETRLLCFSPGATVLGVDFFHRGSLSSTHLGMVRIPLERFGDNAEHLGWFSLVRRKESDPELNPDVSQVLLSIRAIALPPFLLQRKTLVPPSSSEGDTESSEPELLEAFANTSSSSPTPRSPTSPSPQPTSPTPAAAASSPASGSGGSEVRGRTHSGRRKKHHHRHRGRRSRSFWDW